MNKRTMVVMMLVALATTSWAAKNFPQPAPGNLDGPTTVGREAMISIRQMPKLGQGSTFNSPSLSGGSGIGQTYKKPRKWIVLEAEYVTYSKWQDQLTFTWHVLLDTTTSQVKDRADRSQQANYSYFSTTVNYANIPQGSHSASVCLHPSYLERFGQAKAVGLVISNKNGDIVAWDCVSEVTGIAAHPRSPEQGFWSVDAIMNARDRVTGKPLIERRQGLLDRAKTIWGLVNPNDYELVIQ